MPVGLRWSLLSANDVTHHSPDPAVLEAIRAHADWAGGLLPALHAVQHVAGYIDKFYIPALADTFNLSTAEVYGVITYYKDFRTVAPKGPIVQVCRAEACISRGGKATELRALELGATMAVEIEEVFCLGLCAQGPAVATGGRMFTGVDEGMIETIIGKAVRRELAPVSVPVGNAEGVTVFVPRDAAARAAGADEVAAALAAHPGVRVVRNGSRGMMWLEPLVEVATHEGRVAYGPVTADDVPGLLAAGLANAGDHPLRLGLTESLPWMLAQQRVTYARVGVIDPRDAGDYEAHGGMIGLRTALAMKPADVVTEVTESGLRGRGGAAFPTGIKLRTVLDTPSPQKYIVCNADEGDSGSFADRMLMEGDPFLLIEGMVIAGWATGASDGYVYIRSEYPDAIEAIRSAIATCEDRGWLTGTGTMSGVLGSDFQFRLHVRVGAGAYICGEETALMESIEGKRGIVRAKPPLPPSKDCGASRQSSTTCSALLPSPRSSPTVQPRMQHLAMVVVVVRKSCRSLAMWRTAESSRRPSASPFANWSSSSAAVPRAVVRCGQCKSAVHLARISRPTNSTFPSTTRHSPQPARYWVTAAWSCSTTRSTCSAWPASRWSSAPSSPAASAPRAALAVPAVWS